MALTDAQAGATIKEFSGKCYITLAGTVSKGDSLGYSSGWKRALATVGTAIHSRLVAGQDGVSGDVIAAYASCVLADRLTGMTAGNLVYAAEGTSDGKYTETAPSTTGDIKTQIGIALSASEALLYPAYTLGLVA